MSKVFAIEANGKKYELTPFLRLRGMPDGNLMLEQGTVPILEGPQPEGTPPPDLVWFAVPVIQDQQPKIISPHSGRPILKPVN